MLSYYWFKCTFAGLSQGDTEGLPPFVRPSPLPWRWSIGFITTLWTIRHLLNHRLCHVLWSLCLPWQRLYIIPMVAWHQESMNLLTLEGNHIIHCGVFSNFLIIWTKVPPTQINLVPWFGFHSIVCTRVLIGLLANDM